MYSGFLADSRLFASAIRSSVSVKLRAYGPLSGPGFSLINDSFFAASEPVPDGKKGTRIHPRARRLNDGFV